MTENLASWFEKGRPSLFAALEQVCKQIDADIETELKSKTVSEIEPGQAVLCGKEGEDWQWKVCDGSEDGALPYSPPSSADNAPQWRKKVPIDWKAEYAKLQSKYLAVDQNFKFLKQTSYRLRDERKEFRDKARSLHDMILDAEQKHGIKIMDASPQAAAISQALRVEHHTPDPIQGGSFASVEDTGDNQEAPPAAPPLDPVVPQSVLRTGSSEHGHSDSTQGELEGSTRNELPPFQANDEQEAVIKEEPSSDGPVFISERCTNKRKRDGGEAHTPVARIKTEGGHSSPEMSVHHCDFNPHESIDLGEAAPLIWTPRKNREMELEASQRMVQSVETADQGPVPRTDGYARAKPPASSQFASALTAVNVNKRLLQTPATASRGEKPLSKGLSHGIQELAEDGGVYKRNEHRPRGNYSVAKGRLDSLLNSPSVSDDLTPLHRPSKRQPGTSTTPHVDLGVPEPRELPFDGTARTTAKTTNFQTPQSRPPLADSTNTFPKAKAGAGRKKNLSPKRNPGSLLRNKPVAELRAEDFRINPNANKGHDYAFSEVVRDKEERAKLPGCVDEHCCGPTFKALAESEYPDDPTKPGWRQEEQKLLENHLGDYAHRLTGMTRAERKACWIEARMQQLANKHGKHKHHTARMRSPPGFWQFDFPSTQEIEAEREEAARREKQKIQERHREAMRPGGRWLFRDE